VEDVPQKSVGAGLLPPVPPNMNRWTELTAEMVNDWTSDEHLPILMLGAVLGFCCGIFAFCCLGFITTERKRGTYIRGTLIPCCFNLGLWIAFLVWFSNYSWGND